MCTNILFRLYAVFRQLRLVSKIEAINRVRFGAQLVGQWPFGMWLGRMLRSLRNDSWS